MPTIAQLDGTRWKGTSGLWLDLRVHEAIRSPATIEICTRAE